MSIERSYRLRGQQKQILPITAKWEAERESAVFLGSSKDKAADRSFVATSENPTFMSFQLRSRRFSNESLHTRTFSVLKQDAGSRQEAASSPKTIITVGGWHANPKVPMSDESPLGLKVKNRVTVSHTEGRHTSFDETVNEQKLGLYDQKRKSCTGDPPTPSVIVADLKTRNERVSKRASL